MTAKERFSGGKPDKLHNAEEDDDEEEEEEEDEEEERVWQDCLYCITLFIHSFIY